MHFRRRDGNGGADRVLLRDGLEMREEEECEEEGGYNVDGDCRLVALGDGELARVDAGVEKNSVYTWEIFLDARRKGLDRIVRGKVEWPDLHAGSIAASAGHNGLLGGIALFNVADGDDEGRHVVRGQVTCSLEPERVWKEVCDKLEGIQKGVVAGV